MKRVVISVEGQTEEKFVKEVLYPYFINKGIFIDPILLGGYKTYNRIKKEILSIAKRKNCIATTMYDFYGLSKINNFAGIDFDNLNAINSIEKVKNIENSFKHDLNLHNFIPYIQIHEFEAFMFIDSYITSENLPKCNKLAIISYIDAIRNEFDNNPESINDSYQTAPSKRILNKYRQYEKITDGINITKALGIQKILDSCAHFKEWIEKIEQFQL